MVVQVVVHCSERKSRKLRRDLPVEPAGPSQRLVEGFRAVPLVTLLFLGQYTKFDNPADASYGGL